MDNPFEELILDTLEEMANQYTAIYPWMVQARMGMDVSERTLRRYMVRMAAAGRIQRLGERKGYQTREAYNRALRRLKAKQER